MAELLACPFCRELFQEGEAERCTQCDVLLVRLDKLPPSREALEEEALRGEAVALEDRVLPWSYLGRGRGALMLLGVLGLICFFMPWVEMRKPELLSVSGFALARTRAGWLWGGAVGWFMLVPLVWTRRTVYKMRGVRIISATFAAMTLAETLMLMALPPQPTRYVALDFSWGWGLYASAIISVLGILFAARFGGRVDDSDISQLPEPPAPVAARRGETLH